MQWDDLRFFLALARHRTLGSAAKTLGVDATTVARRIDRLAATLGSPLFESGPGGHIPTPRGEALLVHAEEIERSIIRAGEGRPGGAGRLSGTVRLSLSEGFGTWIVAPNVASFAMRHPGIALEIVTTNGFLNPSKREADLAVMLARPKDGPLTARRLTDYSLGLYASAAYLARKGTPGSRADLPDHDLVGYIPDFIYSGELRYLADIDRAIVPAHQSSSINVQLALARGGAGIAVLPDFIGLKHADLIRLLPDQVSIRRSFWSVVHSDLSRVGRFRAVIDWLSEICVSEKAFLLPPEGNAAQPTGNEFPRGR